MVTEHGQSCTSEEREKERSLWRGLEEWMDSPEFARHLADEFPADASEWTDPVSRRQFLTLMGAALALAGVTGCSPSPAPPEEILPYSHPPLGMTPGEPLYFATAMTLRGLATGLLVKSREGRPIKVEGNPSHPASRGATDLFSQASLLDLYDPDRSRAVTFRGAPRGWEQFRADLLPRLESLRRVGGTGLRILTESITSPTLADQLQTILRDFPQAKWVQFDPAGSSAALEGSRLAFGEYANAVYDFTKAERVLTLDADFLACRPETLRYVRDFSGRRRVRPRDGAMGMNRLYSIESMLSNTGAVADHRLALRPSEIGPAAQALAKELGVPGIAAAGLVSAVARSWLASLARDLLRHRGASLILAGEGQPATVHALAYAMNSHLGNVGKTVTFTEPVASRLTDQVAELRQLVEDMKAGRVQMLFILSTNPVYAAPVDLEFKKYLERVPFRLHLGLYQDETAVLCDWHIPEAHYLESWGDARAYDGTVSLIQPLIAPLYGNHSAHEVLATLSMSPDLSPREIVRAHWRSVWEKEKRTTNFDTSWDKSLQEGIISDTAAPRKDMHLRDDWAKQLPIAATPGVLELVFQTDPTVFDGRFANNAWLQELPKPVTKLTWDNAAFMSLRTARELGIEAGGEGVSNPVGASGGEHGRADVEVVELRYRGRTVRAPVWVVPGHVDGAVTVTLGYGRERAGHVGNGIGFNAYHLRTADDLWFGSGLEMKRTGERFLLACTQMHHGMEGRDPVRRGTLAELQRDRNFAKKLPAAEFERQAVDALVPGPGEGRQPTGKDPRLLPLTLYPEVPYTGHRWAMSIDLTTCTGCSACVVACQAENNIPVVGKTQVSHGREMHWIRIDRYYDGDPNASSVGLKAYFQPVPCMHCEKAPCELVCPTGATVHSADGLNDMVYNRCVGTRYCSNNCPYKVRRFNFLAFADFKTPTYRMMYNPEVTVRSRGVMEKCTYCVQRIRRAVIAAERERRPVADGEIVTACQAACPSGAIMFGDLNDPRSEVRRWKSQPQDYGLLAGLNTEPRTTYLAALKNTNSDMASEAGHGA